MTGGPFAGQTVVQQAQSQGYQYVTDAAGLEGVNDDSPVLGLFNSGNMSLEWSGPAASLGKGNAPTACTENQRPANEPSLADMTSSALDLLENKKGFFLQVEGASIDKQDHATNACGQIGETVAFDDAIGVALDYQRSHPRTLVVVTADHSHTSQIVGEDASGSGLPTGYSTNLLTKDGQTLSLTYGTAGYGGAGSAPVAPATLDVEGHPIGLVLRMPHGRARLDASPAAGGVVTDQRQPMSTAGVGGVLDQMRQRLDALPATDLRRHFLGTYLRTTAAVGQAVDRGVFEDPAWVEEWDVVFAQLYLQALDASLTDGPISRPWRLAFDAPPRLHPLQHVLLGVNAHVNYDLPQALLGVISVENFGDPTLLDRRRRDHENIDGVLASRVAAEDDELPVGTLIDRLLTPLNRLASKRFLREARQKVWHNTYELHAARVAGPDAYRVRLAELEVLSSAKIADLLAPGQVLLRLAVAGFGVTLPPPAT